jgi:hypothetical protein
VRIKPSIPGGDVRGHLYSPDELGALDEDMIEVVLPGEAVIHVGWFPPHDPNGEYQITSYVGQYDAAKLDPVCTKEFATALSLLLECVGRMKSATSAA